MFIEFDYTYKTDTIGLTGFSIQLKDVSQGFINDFADTLRSEDAIQWVGKFHDAHMKNNYAQHTQDIFDIEMKLREVLTFIFLNRYPNAPYDVLSEFKHKPKSDRLHTKDSTSKREETLKPLFENEFFHLLFSDYIKLDHHALKPIGNDDVISAITSSENFKALQNQLTARGIQNEKHNDFIASIKDSLQSIETFRNCIAHNRAYTDDEKENYEKSLDRIQYEIRNFWTSINTKIDNELDNSDWPWNEKARNAVQQALEHAGLGSDSMIIWHNSEEHTVQSYDELFQLLCEIASDEAVNYMPGDEESREMAEDTFSPENEVNEVLPFFANELQDLGWRSSNG